MLRRLSRLFVIKTRFEALAVIYALAVGGAERGIHYLHEYPGLGGYLLFAACGGSVLMAGAKILDAVTPAPVAKAVASGGAERRRGERRTIDRRQAPPARPA